MIVGDKIRSGINAFGRNLQIDLKETPWLSDPKELMEAQERLVEKLCQAGLVGDYGKPFTVSPGKHWKPVSI